MGRVYAAFRREKFTVRSATKNKYLRITWTDGTSVTAGFVTKGRSKSQIAIEHSKPESKLAAGRMKAFWTEKLATLVVQDGS